MAYGAVYWAEPLHRASPIHHAIAGKGLNRRVTESADPPRRCQMSRRAADVENIPKKPVRPRATRNLPAFALRKDLEHVNKHQHQHNQNQKHQHQHQQLPKQGTLGSQT